MNQLCDFRAALPHDLHRALVEADRREAGRARKAFLAAGIDGVDLPSVDVERNAPERRHRVDDRQAAVRVRDPDEFPGVGKRAGRGFRMNEREKPGIRMIFQRVLDLAGVDRAPPLLFHHHRDPAAALDVFLHPSPEDAVPADDDFIARLQEIHETGLHPGGSGAGDHHRHFVLRPERVLEELLDLFHHADERRIHVADRRTGHRLQDARMDVGRTGPQQGPRRGNERADRHETPPSG